MLYNFKMGAFDSHPIQIIVGKAQIYIFSVYNEYTYVYFSSLVTMV